jgi:hypothetical protein
MSRRSWYVPAVLTLVAITGLGAARPALPQARRIFGGRVVRVDAKSKLFVLQSASKRQPEVVIRHDAKTAWKDFPIRKPVLTTSTRVFAECVPAPGRPGEFQAVTLRYLDPNRKPMAGSGSARSGR